MRDPDTAYDREEEDAASTTTSPPTSRAVVVGMALMALAVIGFISLSAAGAPHGLCPLALGTGSCVVLYLVCFLFLIGGMCAVCGLYGDACAPMEVLHRMLLLPCCACCGDPTTPSPTAEQAALLSASGNDDEDKAPVHHRTSHS